MATWGGSHIVDNFEQIEFSIGTETSKVLEYVMENIVLPQLRDFIENDVYSYSGEQSDSFWNKRVPRKGGSFFNVWKTKVQRRGFYNDVILYADESSFARFSDKRDSRHRIGSANSLSQVINKGWNSDNFSEPPCNFPAIRPRPFWNDFIDWMNANFEDIFLAECNKRGLNMTITGDLKFKKGDN